MKTASVEQTMLSMARLLKYSQALRTPCAPIEPAEFGSGWLKGLVADLFRVMYECEGVGLAAPQIGVFKRVAVIEFTEDRKQQNGEQGQHLERWALINPVIEETSGSQKVNEGCLSIPGYRADIVRPAEVVCRFQDEFGEYHRIVGTGMLAQALQHECDHLEGRLLVDRMGRVTRDMFERRWKKKLAAQA